MRPEPHIIHHDDAIVIASWRELFWYCWKGRGTARHAALLVEAHRGFLQQRAGEQTLALAHVTPPAMTPPDEGMRAEFRKHVEVVRDIGAIATVIDGDGFTAALTRGLVSSLTLFSSGAAPHRVFRTVREGLSFLLEKREPWAKIELDELAAAYDSVMRRSST